MKVLKLSSLINQNIFHGIFIFEPMNNNFYYLAF